MISVRALAATAVKVAAAGVDLVHRPVDGLVVLIYHRVGGRTASEVDLPAALFDAQVAELVGSRRIVSFDEGLDRLVSGDLAGSPVVLTFDDGTADWVEDVLPILQRHRAPATFFVATDFVDRSRRFPGGAAPISWPGLRELHSSGLATIGSHTHTHVLLDRAPIDAVEAELDRSIARIEDELGAPCEHFAYPKALLGSPSAQAAVRARFRTASIAGTRANPVGTSLHELHRTPVQVGDGMRWFRRKAAGGMRFEDVARTTVNRARYAGATS